MKRVTLLVLAILGLLVSSRSLAQQVDICTDPVDQQCRQCVTQVATYSSWMIVPGDGKTSGPLQKAIDGTSDDVQNEWAGPISQRTYLRVAYLEAPLAFAALLIIVFVVRQLFRPQLHATRGPLWRVEKTVLVVAPLLILIAIASERWLTYGRLVSDYGEIRERVSPFVRLTSPRAAVRSTNDPCEFAFGADVARVNQCKTEQNDTKKERTKAQRFTNPELLNAFLAVAQSCRSAELPVWWREPTKEQGLDCPVYGTGAATIQFRDVAGVRGFEAWLTANSTDRVAPVLDLTDAFSVRAATGALYKEKISDLAGDHKRYYRMYLTRSALPLAAVVLIVGFYVALIWLGRTRELLGGSRFWRNVQFYANLTAVVLCVAWIAALVAVGAFV